MELLEPLKPGIIYPAMHLDIRHPLKLVRRPPVHDAGDATHLERRTDVFSPVLLTAGIYGLSVWFGGGLSSISGADALCQGRAGVSVLDGFAHSSDVGHLLPPASPPDRRIHGGVIHDTDLGNEERARTLGTFQESRCSAGRLRYHQCPRAEVVPRDIRRPATRGRWLRDPAVAPGND